MKQKQQNLKQIPKSLQNKKQKTKAHKARKALLPYLEKFKSMMLNEPEIQFSYKQLDDFAQEYEKVTSSLIATHQLSKDLQIQIRDFKFKMSLDEDDIFASNKQIHQNFRRGLTYINYGNGWQILRKGQKKFFDIYFNDFQGKGQIFCETLNDYTIGKAINLAQQNKIIEIFITEKANGENCQISYCKEIDCWSVSSKNKTIVVRNEADIQSDYYKQDCYNVASKVAIEWFNIIRNKQDKIQEIKKLLADHTFVAEYIGHKEFQHLVRYDKISIRFFSIVKKIGLETCITPKIAIEIFDKLGFERVKFRELTAQGEADLNNKIKLIEQEISAKSIADEGEGCVLYFCNSETNECLSLAKLKTIEYRIARKIREKVKRLLLINQDKQVLLNKFIQECEQFPYFNDPEFQKQYYIQLFERVLNFGFHVKATINDEKSIKLIFSQVRNKYLDFLDLIKQNKDNQFITSHYLNMKDVDLDSADEEDEQEIMD